MTPISLPVSVRYDADPARATLVDARGEDVLTLPYREVQTIERLAEAMNRDRPDLSQLHAARHHWTAAVKSLEIEPRGQRAWKAASDAVRAAREDVLTAAIMLTDRYKEPAS